MNWSISAIKKIEEKMSDVKVLIFDVDGVLIESAEIRDEAFVYVFESIGCKEKDRVLDIHRNNYGVYRKKQLALIYQEIFQSDPSQDLIQELYDRFSSWVWKRVISCPLVPGTLEVLNLKKDMPCYIVSAAPQEEVIDVASHHKIAEYFEAIYGGPTKKKDLIEFVLERGNWTPEQAVFVGDRISDWKSAQNTGVNFIGRIKSNEENPFPSETFIIFDLFPLLDLLAKRFNFKQNSYFHIKNHSTWN